MQGRVDNASAHHIVPTGLEHQPFSDPVKFPKKMLSSFAHGSTRQHRTSLFYNTHRITTGMGINAMKDMLHENRRVWFRKYIEFYL